MSRKIIFNFPKERAREFGLICLFFNDIWPFPTYADTLTFDKNNSNMSFSLDNPEAPWNISASLGFVHIIKLNQPFSPVQSAKTVVLFFLIVLSDTCFG